MIFNFFFNITNIHMLLALPYQCEAFSLLHHRFVIKHVPRNLQSAYWNECFRVCKRNGGMIEIQERTLRLGFVGLIGQQINTWLRYAALAHDYAVPEAKELEHDVRHAGFQISQSKEIRMPVGSWAGPLGEASLNEVRLTLEADRQLLIDHFEVDGDEFDMTLAAWRAEVAHVQTYWPIHVLIAYRS
jgi:hypothetical protein